MTIKTYILQKFQSFNMNLSEADILDICLASDINGEDEMDNACFASVSVAIARFIPSLLLRASSVNESGFSMSWNTQGIKEYYSYLCRRYGIDDELNQKPKVIFL